VKHEWRIILDAGKVVGAILEEQQFSAQRRTRNATSSVTYWVVTTCIVEIKDAHARM